MTKTLRAALGVAAGMLLATSARAVDMTWTFAVQTSAEVTASPPRIELKWPADQFPLSGYTLQRKNPAETTWGSPVALPPWSTSFSDENVEVGRVYEYQIIKHALAYTGYGYISVGIEAPLVDARGRLILIVDRTIAEPLAAELDRFQRDLVGDGWSVARRDIGRDDRPADVKAVIKAEYEADRAATKALLLFGHVPVVRSGNQNVDGHGARPMPADVFYADLDGEWTDHDGDGTYDQSTLPSETELQVGRVDFADLPGKYSPVQYPSEVELLRRYLNKNHAFRHAQVRPAARALIGNAVGDNNGHAPAASAYRSLAPLVGAANVFTVGGEVTIPDDERWVSRLIAGDYLWAFAGGAGGDFSIGGMGLHGQWGDLWGSDFIQHNLKATFYTMYGSWFADWAQPDNVMRTALAGAEHGLAAVWSGRPHLFFHYMAIGETIGQAMRLSQNNTGHYQNQVQRQLRGVHFALLGDPTLRAQPLAPPTEAHASADGEGTVVTWKPSRDAVVGYHVYRAVAPSEPFARLTEAPMNDLRFVDTRPGAASATYLVRAVALHTTHSGSFYHASQGAYATTGALSAGSSTPAPTTPENGTKPSDAVWVDDALPTGALGYATPNDRWNWVAANPAPFSGGYAHQSENAAGLHHHFFGFAATPLQVGSGDTLFAYIYLDPANPPRQVMLTWCSEHWEHRAYWGENLVQEGAEGTAGRRYMGPLPPTGRWVRLEVPASVVDMENRSATGMGFTLVDGRATWDRAGKSRP